MPITRYQIRNEYSLADPELYLAANKDDPEALLEGVAMAGLVGVLRQLGDLSEFAAEIFHSLHEEVMVTAARGHSLTARVQQLEAEVPLIEKAILSQTNHSSSLHTAGVEWHPNLRMNQNMITQGDLPRFVMDSYEECRGPPRLFILDKFDIAGAGACLKRYTNPAFFKVEPASTGTPNVDSQRDRRIRKVKKGARGRNGEIPEILPTSNVKLHRLFLEDRAENSGSEPARLVKLKKRHLQGSPFNSQTGKSYMQKLLQTSPEHKFVRDIPIDPPSDNLISNSIGHGPKILDIQTVSSATESLQSIRDRYETPIAQETVQNSSMDEISEEVSDGENLRMPAIGHDHEMDKMMSMLYKTADEKELAVDRKSTPESSVNESEIDVASETDNFMDALNSLESEIETDTECRRKNSLSLFNGEKHGTDSDANDEQNKNLSENGFLSFSKGTASSSYSDLSGLAGGGSAEVAAVESVDTSFDKMCIGDEVLGTKSCQDSVANSRCSEVSEVQTIQAEHDKLPLDGECSGDVSSAGSERKFDTDELGRGFFNTDTNGNSTGEILPMVTVSSIPSLKMVLPSESCQPINLDSGLNLEENSINVVLHTDDDSCRSSLSECSEHLLSDLEPDCEDNCIENVENAVDENVNRYYRSKVSSTEEQILSSTFPEPEPLSGITQQPNALHASTTYNSEDPAPLVDNPRLKSSSEQKSSERTYSFQAIDRNLVETGVLHSQETTDYGGVCSTKDFGEIDASACNGDGIVCEIVSSKFSSEYPDYETFEDQVHEHTGIRNVQAKDEGGMAPSIAFSVNNGRESSNLLLDMPCSSSRNSMDMQDSLSISACPHQKRVEMHDSRPPECHVESDVPAKQSMSSSGATRDDKHKNISPIHDVTTSELQTGQETELETHHPTRTLDIFKTFGSVRTRHTLDPGYHTKQIVEEQAEQLDAATPKFLFSHYEQKSELNDISQDRYSSTTRESSLEDLPGQASISNSSLQSTSVKLESYEKAMATSLPFFPKVSLLSPGSQVSIEEPSQLPPLPPMQWRVGKLPHEHSFDSYPPIPPPTDNENAQSDAITSKENQQSHNLFLQPSDIINNESQYVTEDFAGPSPFSLPIPTTVSSSADNQDLTASVGSKQSLNPFVSLPSSPERPQDSSVAVEEERTHHTANVLSLETPVENANSAEDKELEHNFQNSREKVSNLMLFHPPLVENLQPQFGQEGPGEVSNPNENTTVKLPRPRNPLIDAVAAHGKNSLRKVTERARPPIEKEVEERDTMLEQIRNKTFNLKPAVPIRPRIQPPQTNLKMAAILEKANKIRQATVGSDEDDNDNWSDD